MPAVLFGAARLERFLKAVADAGVTLRMKKCVFLATRIKFLGHNVSRDGIEPGDEKVKAIRMFPAPKDIHEVRRFLGLRAFLGNSSRSTRASRNRSRS